LLCLKVSFIQFIKEVEEELLSEKVAFHVKLSAITICLVLWAKPALKDFGSINISQTAIVEVEGF
jgi:type III secretory pathway component EscS